MSPRERFSCLVVLCGCELGASPATDSNVEPPQAAAVAIEPTEVIQPAEVIQVEAQTMTGVLVPQAEVVLVASGFARLERLDVQVGDHVGEGVVVAEMDVRGDRSELAAATASWKASTAELERLTLELEQARAARADVEQLESFVAKAELREQRYAEKRAAARKRSASASLQQERSRMKEAETRIAEAELRAPFAGVIARRYVDPGATLSTGEAVVLLISDARLLRFAVPEDRGEALSLGVKVAVEFVEEGVELVGVVTTIAPEIEAGTRLIFAEARLGSTPSDEGRPEELRVGAVGQVRFVHSG